MTGIITSIPPLVEQPPGNNSSNPAGLPGVTYSAAIPVLPQTWTGLQTFNNGSVTFAGSTSGRTFLNATAIASGVLTLPAATDTLVARNTVDTLTNKSIDGLTNTITNVPSGALDPDLTAIAALTGSGILSRTGTNTWALRSVVAGFGMTVTNGDGVSGNMSVALTDSELVALAGLVSAADQLPYFTGSGTASLTTLTTFARTLLDDTTQGAMQTTLGLVPGTNVQAFDSDLSAVAALATTGLIARTGAGTAATRTLQSAAAGLTWTNGDGVAGNPTPVLADDLAAVEGLATTGIVRRTSTSTWSAGTAVALSELATQGAYTIVANATGSSAVPTAMDITALTAKASPVSADIVLIQDSAASNAFKRTTVGALASAGSVSSIAGNTGAFTLANGIDNSANQIQLTAARRTLPTQQIFLSGSGTYTTPANVLWIRVRMVGGGGGGSGSGTGGGGTGGTGGTTTFGSSVLTCLGGVGGATNSSGGAGGAATALAGSPLPVGLSIPGSDGDPSAGLPAAANDTAVGGSGGASFFGGKGSGGGGTGPAAPTAGKTNTGSGGGGAASIATGTFPGAGGGASAFIDAIINSPSATYAYAIGAAGTAGTAGTSGTAGAAGGSGIIIVEEHYGS